MLDIYPAMNQDKGINVLGGVENNVHVLLIFSELDIIKTKYPFFIINPSIAIVRYVHHSCVYYYGDAACCYITSATAAPAVVEITRT